MKLLFIIAFLLLLAVGFGLSYLILWFLTNQSNLMLWGIGTKIIFFILGWIMFKIVVEILTIDYK